MENDKLIAALRHNTAMDAMSKRHMRTDLMAADVLETAEKEIERLKAENRNIRENSVSHEVYKAVCAERDAAVEDLREAIFNADVNSCTFCLHANPDVNAAPYCLADFCDNDEWQWRGPQEAGEEAKNEHKGLY